MLAEDGAQRLGRRATLRDVAKLAGVSQSTASRAVSGNGYVAADVLERVNDAAERLGYVADAMARNLRKRDSDTVGVLVSDLRNSFYAEFAAGIASAAREHGYTVVLVDDRGSKDAELDAARAFVAMRVAGVIVTPLSKAVSDFLIQQRIPVIEADRQFAEGKCDSVSINNADISRRVTEHLASLGHRRIAMIADETDWTTGAERSRGFREALEEFSIPPEHAPIVSAGWSVAEARAVTVDLLARRERPTAIFAVNNVIAEGAWRAVSDLGFSIPTTLSVVSFDDAQWMSMVTPGVTAVSYDAGAIGEAAMTALVKRIEDPAAPPGATVLEAHLVPRGSTAPPAPDQG